MPALLTTETLEDQEGHPERPARIEAILDALHKSQLLSRTDVRKLLSCSWPKIQASALSAIHPGPYTDWLQSKSLQLKGPSMLDDSTYMAPGSYEASMRSLSAACAVLDTVLGAAACVAAAPPAEAASLLPADPCQAQGAPGVSPCGFALVRPPGHHVEPARPMGFGLINIIALLARRAQQLHGLKQVLIVDIDVHHGNGTQEAFYEDASVLYISIHQAGAYPGTGKLSTQGAGPGLGATINVPLPGGSGDLGLRAFLQRVVWPAAERFKPDVLLVSAGYDAHWRDPLAGHQLTAASYHHACHELRRLAQQLCHGRAVFVLEGGYELRALGACVVASFEALLGLPSQPDSEDSGARLQPEPIAKIEAVLDAVCRLHAL